MQDLHQANHTDTTLTKLLDVDSTLAQQEAQLQSQLQEIQAKRKSLESVISIFSPSAPAPASVAEVPVEVELPVVETKNGKSPEAAPVPATETAPKRGRKPKATSEKAKVPAKAPKTTTSKSSTDAAKADPKTKAPKASTKTSAKASNKVARRSQDWQQYVRDEFSKTSLPEAVSNVLQRQSNDVVGIPEMIDSIFLDEMPKQVRSKASNRISNILSTGLKDNKWYRGKTGHYSVSRNAAIADLAS
ncbi:hypothetical protein IQ268_29310 [Oculatella sp. LEGE 06141]|uniref:hypothetical protein n=1 Tax=Oculatella sp. LEGE 06141 TaxID=1828648 RepID=UPI001882F345|nr:hypothetical protein [Oculatella sp. LEGE 06141]MBE9182640.1 hypothetical protein [Oculatella sp. LEGE 06141]